MRFLFFGGYDPSYPRNAVNRKGLVRAGADVRDITVSGHFKAWARYPLLALRFPAGWHWLRRDSNAVVFVPAFRQKDVPAAAALAFLARRRVVFDPLVSRYQTKILDWRRRPPGSLTAWWNFQVDRWAFRLSGLVLADTGEHARYFVETFGVPAAKVKVLPLGIDDDVFRESSKPARAREANKDKRQRFNVLFFGSFLPLHGADAVVRAAAVVAKKDPSVFFRFIGEGQTYPAARAEAERLGLRNVEFVGRLPAAELPARVAEADLCLGIFGTTAKAGRVVPHKVFQSLAMRKPLLTLRTPAVEEFFAHGEHLYLCDSADPGVVAGAILKLKKDATLRRKIADGGYALVRMRYTPEAIGRLILEIVVPEGGRS
jgi:glycosyltransferase involved in cell wall biosynthesis